MTDQPEIHLADDGAVLATWRGHVLAIWTDTARVDAARRLSRLALDCARVQPGRTAYVAQLDTSLALPTPEVRGVFSRLGRQLGADMGCIAAAVEGRGFKASAMRAAVTGIGLAARLKFPLSCFSTLDEAALWASNETKRRGGSLGTVAEVLEAFTALRERRPAPP